MKDDDELEMLLGEIPHATSSFSLQHMLNNATNHHHRLDHGYGHASYETQRMHAHGQGPVQGQGTIHLMDNESLKHKCTFASSPVNGFSLTSDGPSSSLFSGGRRSHSDNLSPPQFEESKPHLIPGNGFCSDSKKDGENNLVDYLNLSRDFSKMYIRDEREGVTLPPYGIHHSPNGATRNLEKSRASDDYRNGFSYRVSVPINPMGWEAGSALVEIPYDQRMANLIRSQFSPSPSDRLFCWSDIGNSSMAPQFYRNTAYPMGFVVPNAPPSLDNPSVCNPVSYPSQNRMNLIEGSDSFYSSNMAQVTPLVPHYSAKSLIRHQQPAPNGRNKVPVRVRVPQDRVEAFDREDGLIVPGEGINYRMARRNNSHHENGAWKTHEKRSQLNGHLHNAVVSKMHCPFNRPPKFSSLAEAQGYIYHIAKDQQGCRFLQRMFDEGTSLDVQIIFNEIIDHAVELMMNPFGNYLTQKLLEVCNEEQRMHILFRVTEEPGELVKISLNTHGTRVVQKLIETLKTKQQISLVISALEPGFLALIKDLNGNHVIQRCLQCFPSEDSKFIFVAAAKYCVDIATHQHGCCVLQRCISHSTGEHRKNLVAEISANGLLLAEDAFGNYVVQFILELKIPYAIAKLTSQFEGNYVHLSSQKFSSHVVEKCLSVCNEEVRAKIIHELLSATCFDHLLQDPHANYVVQTALRVSEGNLHNALVDAIESYKAISRNSPYSKRIFSQKLLKR